MNVNMYFVANRESTTSMTSVPKPLKFLRSHYKELKDLYESTPANKQNKAALADIISVMGITSGQEGARESLHFRYPLQPKLYPLADFVHVLLLCSTPEQRQSHICLTLKFYCKPELACSDTTRHEA